MCQYLGFREKHLAELRSCLYGQSRDCGAGPVSLLVKVILWGEKKGIALHESKIGTMLILIMSGWPINVLTERIGKQ